MELEPCGCGECREDDGVVVVAGDVVELLKRLAGADPVAARFRRPRSVDLEQSRVPKKSGRRTVDRVDG